MYGEIIVGVNMLFNYAILSFANKVGNVHAARGRLLFASLTGALPVVLFPSSIIAVILSFLGMTLYAFGKTFEPWKKSASMVLSRGCICRWIINCVPIPDQCVQ